MTDEQEYPLLDPTALKPPLNTKLITDEAGIEEMCQYLSGLEIIGYDIETNVVDHFTERKIRTIQLGDRNLQYVVDLLGLAGSEEAMLQQGHRTPPVWAQSLTNALQRFVGSGDYLKVGQNLSFEHETVLWNLGVRGWRYYDTMLAEKIIRCGQYPLYARDVWGLKDIVARYYKKALSKKEQKGFDLCIPLRFEQIEYAGLDIRLPIAVRELQMKLAAKDGLQRAIDIENDAIPAFSEMKVNGLLFDQDEWKAIVESNLVKHCQNVAALDKYFIPIYGTVDNPITDVTEDDVQRLEAVWKEETEDRELRAYNRTVHQAAARKYRERMKDSKKWEGRAACNYGSDETILEGLKAMGYKVVATNEKALSKVRSEPVVKAVTAYRETSTALSRYGLGYLDYVNPATGRIHSNFSQFGAETGRTSSNKPNVQQLPSENRHTVKAQPGYVIITTDMSGAELRIMAELSGDPTWIEMFEKGWDVHSVGAEMIFGVAWKDAAKPDCEYYKTRQKCKCPEHKTMREAIKAINFGIAYGMSQYSLADRLGISTQEALKLLTKWREINARLATYLKESGLSAKRTLCAYAMSGFRRTFKAPDYQRCKATAIERSLKDKGHPNIDTNATNKVYASAWGAIEREGTNMPIQSSNAAIAKLAMGCGFDKNGKPFMYHVLIKYKSFIINMVHDEVVVESPQECAQECAAAIRDCIRRAGAEFMTKVVMQAESAIGPRWEK